MSYTPSEVVELVQKLHFVPGDVLVLRLAEMDPCTYPEDTLRALFDEFKKLPPAVQNMPVIVQTAGDLEIAKLEEPEARELYRALWKRFGGKAPS